ncbi:MAG: PAS domain-containing protein, partial [Pseudomonas sp.]
LLALLLGLPWLLSVLPPPLCLPLVGLSMLGLALVWGFPGALCGAGLSSLGILALPLARGLGGAAQWLEPQRGELQLSLLLLMLATLLVGRSLSDLRLALGRSAQMQQQLALANLALEASPLGMTIVDARQPDQPLLYCNPAFERISGYGREEILGRNCRFLLADDQEQPGLPALRTALARGESCQVVLRNYRKDGSLFWNEITLAPMRDAQGISHYVAMQHDVTLRERLAAELETRREELLRQTQLLSQTEALADIGGWVLELPSYRLFWSEGCFRIYELDPGAGPPSFEAVLDYFEPTSRALAAQTLNQLLTQGWSFDLELRLLSARGNPRWVRIKGLAERDGAQVTRIYGAIQDISARKRHEQQLQERGEWLRLFFEAPLIGMAMIGPQRQWLEVNAKLCQILGRSSEALRASTWPAITHPDDVPLEERLFEAVMAGRRDDYELDKRFLREDGSVVYSRLSLRAVRDQRGRLEACLALVEDITARSEAEARYRTLVEHAPEAVLVLDSERGIVEANENAARLLGLPQE